MPCLVEKYANAFTKALQNGDINPDRLSTMPSDKRRALLEQYVGKDNAKWVNAEFETKLLLKNQQRGMITWAKKVAGITPATRRDIIAKIERMDKALTSTEERPFLEDLVERRLGVQVTEEEGNTILELTKAIKGTEPGTMEYGTAKQKLVAFMREHGPVEAVHPVADVASVMRAFKTGFDLSASLRQGSAYFGTKEWNGAFVRMFGYAKSQQNLDELEASFYGNKYSDVVLKVKRELGLTMLGETFTQREEAFASRFINKVPLLGGSNRAYEGFLNDVRFNRFVNLLAQLDKANNGITDNIEAMKDLAKVIASATGRGDMASSRVLTAALFSPRWIASRIQLVTNVATKRGEAQKEAAKALARTTGVAVAILGMYKMAGGDDDDEAFDPRSANFGKVMIKNTRFDVTGGMGPYIVMLWRIGSGETRSSTTGVVKELNTGRWGSMTKFSLMSDFLTNKMAPIPSAIRDWLKGESFEGDPLNFDRPKKELLKYFGKQFLVPMLVTDTVEAYQESADNKLAMGITAGVSSLFGLSANTYQYKPYGTKWKKLKEINEELYDKKVEKAQMLFKQRMDQLQKMPAFVVAPDVGKRSKSEYIDKERKRIERSVIG